MYVLIAGLVIFLGVHSISIINVAWRDRVVARIGVLLWQGIYSLISVIALIMIIQGYQTAQQAPIILYLPPAWLNPVALVLLIFIFPLLLAAYIPGRIQTITKHPMLAATKIWAFAHLLVNGSLADVVLFGSFLAWAVLDRISLKRRRPDSMPMLPATKANDTIVIVAGLLLYAVFLFWAHEWVIGISPL
jgi:uncharacterized membrane protein